MPTDTTEKGLETLIMRYMTGGDGFSPVGGPGLRESRVRTAAGAGGGWIAGCPEDYDRAHCLDVAQLFAFLHATQPDTLKKAGIGDYRDAKDITRQKFLARISAEIGKRGVIDVLRRGIDDGPLHFDLFFVMPSPGNETAAAKFAKNRFSITRQLRYSLDETRRALALCAFINGLPLATFELKNSLTKQTVEDAVEQYRRDRIPGRSCSSSAAVRCTLPSTTPKSGCAPNSRARRAGFPPSTKVGTTGRATRRIRRA